MAGKLHDTTERLRANQEASADSSQNIQRIGELVSSSQAAFAKYDVSLEANQGALSSISEQSDLLAKIVNGLKEVRDASIGSFHEQSVASNKLSEIRSEITNNNDLTDEQRAMLMGMSDSLRSGFKTTSRILETTKKSLAEYSDAAVAGITTMLGNSPVTLFLSKIVTDQAKAFFARRKEKREHRLELAKAKAIDEQKLDASTENSESNEKNLTENESQTKSLGWMKKVALARLLLDKSSVVRNATSTVARKLHIGTSSSLESMSNEEREREGRKSHRISSKLKKPKKHNFLFRALLILGSLIMSMITPAFTALSNAIIPISDAFLMLGKKIVSLAGGISTFIKNLPSHAAGLVDKVKKVGKKVKTVGKKAIGYVKEKGKDFVDGSKKIGGRFATSVAEKLGGKEIAMLTAKEGVKYAGRVAVTAASGPAAPVVGALMLAWTLADIGKLAYDKLGKKVKKDAKPDSNTGVDTNKRQEYVTSSAAPEATYPVGSKIASNQSSVANTMSSANQSSVARNVTRSQKATIIKSDIVQLTAQSITKPTIENRNQKSNSITGIVSEGAIRSNTHQTNYSAAPVALSSSMVTNNNATTVMTPPKPENVERSYLDTLKRGAL